MLFHTFALAFMDTVTLIGYLAAFCTAFSFVPQVYKIIRTRNTESISLAMYALFVTGVFFWLVYGILIWSLPVIFANVLTLTLAASVLILKIYNGRK